MNYKIPYDFVLRYIYPIRPRIVRMLGCYALVEKDMILLMLRERTNQPEFNGVFIATHPKFFNELEEEIHATNMEYNIDGQPHSYLFLSEDLEDFEDKVKKACELIKAGDKRIGKALHS